MSKEIQEELRAILNRYERHVICEEWHIHSDDPEFKNEKSAYSLSEHKDFDEDQAIASLTSLITRDIDENTSDGYHTFKELYHYRMLYNAALFNEWAAQGKYDVHKSVRHSDGELAFDGGWFVVVAQLPQGQITNHYEQHHWYKFEIPERFEAIAWDGHTPQDVANRLEAYLKAYESTASEQRETEGNDIANPGLRSEQ